MLTTERLTLRRPVASDLDHLYAIHSNPLTYQHLPSGRMTTLAQAQQRLDEWIQHWDEHGFGYAVVELTTDATVLGFTGPAHATLADRPILNLYYRFDPSSWGHGYAVEAAAAVVGWCHTHHPDVPLVARVATNNPGSIKVAERIGLVRQAVTDPADEVEHVIYASSAIAR